eukprot:jgi/Picsp_1/4837/NSC_02202-R2_e set domain-containing protein
MRISRFEERGSLAIVSDTLGNKVDSGVCVSVGDAIDVFEENILRGHGTQVRDESLVATVCGVVDRVNKLICVRALHRRYSAEVGDVVVGRVSERQHMIVLEDLGVQMILGCNGLIWVGAPTRDDSHDDLKHISIEQSMIISIARVVQSIRALSYLRRMVSTLSVTKVVSLSMEMHISPPSMLGTHFLEMVAALNFETMT